jgi:hypothetical protein
MAPGKAPSVYMADGMVKTPVAKMTKGNSVSIQLSRRPCDFRTLQKDH